MSINFLEPYFLYLLVPLIALFVLWFGIAAIKRIKRPKRTFGSKYPLIGKIKLWGFFVTPVAILIIMALARPALNQGSLNPSRGDVEVIVVVDRSISMRADDIRPTRLDIAKREVEKIESFLTEGDKVALFIFGQESHVKMRLSGRLETTFERLAKISFPTSLQGDALIWDSDFASMLENIYQSLDRQDSGDRDYLKNHYVPKKRTNRIVIIFSDGEDQFRKDKSTKEDEIK